MPTIIRFSDFVAIKQESLPETSMDYKAISSFIEATYSGEELPLDSQLNRWLSKMIEKGLSCSTRKRYVEKLSSIYKGFKKETTDDSNPFETVRRLIDINTDILTKDIELQCLKLSGIIGNILQDAKKRPEPALFLYLLLNASSDMEKAILLTTDEYEPVLPQLSEIINPSKFHHSRKYIFNLNQSRKRLPQLVRESIKAIDYYLKSKGLHFKSHFTPKIIASLWIAKAHAVGISLSEIKSTVNIIPPEYEFVKYINGLSLSVNEKYNIKRKVAEAFLPTDQRWFAMKLRKGVTLDDTTKYLKSQFPNVIEETSFYYPTREVRKRVGKRLVKNVIPFIPDILFLKTGQNLIAGIDRAVRNGNLGWMFRQTNNPDSGYSVIGFTAMKIFQKTIGQFTSDMKMELTRERPTGIGRKVRITGGMLEGYTGTIYNIRKDAVDDSYEIFIHLSEEYGLKVELKIEEYFVEYIDRTDSPLGHS